MNYNYIFLLSMPRSGSTLFRLLLNNIDGVVALPETFFFVFLDNNKHLKLSNPEQKKHLLKNWVNYYTTRRIISNLSVLEENLNQKVTKYQDILDITVAQYIEENNLQNVKWVVEKSPPHIFFQNQIKQLYPNAKAVYLLRDPRAVAGSMLNKTWATHNIYAIARSWNKSTQLMGNINPSIKVRYEDLVAQNDTTYTAITSFFNSSISKEEFYTTASASSVKGIAKEFHTNLGAPVATKHIDKWQHQLSVVDREQYIIEHVCKQQMLNNNYAISPFKKDIAFYGCLMFDYFKFIFTATANKWLK
jgi:hypothetical protein